MATTVRAGARALRARAAGAAPQSDSLIGVVPKGLAQQWQDLGAIVGNREGASTGNRSVRRGSPVIVGAAGPAAPKASRGGRERDNCREDEADRDPALCGHTASYARRTAIHAPAEVAKASGRGPRRAYTGSTTDSREGAAVQEMVIYGVSFDMVGKQPIVLLKTADSNKFLPIWIGHPEAAAILMKLQGATTPRPMTHDLLVDMLGELDVRCTQVAVTELRDNTFFASITLAVNGRELEIDSRPSDALALAVRSGAPIFAAEDVIAESAIEFEHEVEDTEEVVDRFKEFLDQVTPEDFAGDS
jgi:bifunctional DNase/RNase